MPDRCDKGCRRHVRVIWALWRDDLPERDWMLCGVCSDADADVLVEQGWVLVEDERDERVAYDAGTRTTRPHSSTDTDSRL